MTNVPSSTAQPIKKGHSDFKVSEKSADVFHVTGSYTPAANFTRSPSASGRLNVDFWSNDIRVGGAIDTKTWTCSMYPVVGGMSLSTMEGDLKGEGFEIRMRLDKVVGAAEDRMEEGKKVLCLFKLAVNEHLGC